jgi:N-acetylneuraminic acid mutarotase
MFLFAGEDQYGNKLNDLHTYNMETEEWTEINCTGTVPSVRSGHSATVYQNQLIVFGGRAPSQWLNDCYSLDMDSFIWKLLEVKGGIPKPRCGHSGTVWGKDMVVYGGKAKRVHSDVFELDLGG